MDVKLLKRPLIFLVTGPARKQQESYMGVDEKQQALLRKLPGVDHIMTLAQKEGGFDDTPKTVLVSSIRTVIENLRCNILEGTGDLPIESGSDFPSDHQILETVKTHVEAALSLNLLPVVNATGVVVHTNLGRSLLAKEAIDHLLTISSRYSTLEFDLSAGKRGSRYSCVEDILCEVSGAEAGMVVNNNAAAVLLCLETIAKDKEVIVSRGELVEIGGSFRIPEVMAKSGGILKEVGATNRTHPHDYENAINHNTGLLLKVHTSNYSVVGFTSAVSLKELVALGAQYHLPVMEDLGSGTFVDFSKYGLSKEPTVQESVAAGVDILTFSGDKLLGGPQAGIILGKKDLLDKIKKNPLTRALRIDKTTLSALESTLRLYRDERKAIRSIPTLRMLTASIDEIEGKAVQLEEILRKIEDSRLEITRLTLSSRAGGGALPLMELPSRCLGISVTGMSPNEVERTLRSHKPAVIGRIEADLFIMDLRTILCDEFPIINDAITNLLKKVY